MYSFFSDLQKKMFVDDRSLALKYNYKSSHGIYKYLKDVLIDLTRYMGHVSQLCFHPSLEVKNNVTTVEKKIERKKFLNYDFDCSTIKVTKPREKRRIKRMQIVGIEGIYKVLLFQAIFAL